MPHNKNSKNQRDRNQIKADMFENGHITAKALAMGNTAGKFKLYVPEIRATIYARSETHAHDFLKRITEKKKNPSRGGNPK